MSQHVQPTKVPQERDFTGGMVPGFSCSYVGSTGEKDLDGRIMELAQSMESVSDPCLLAEMMITAIRISRGAVTEGEFKLMNRALKEMRAANRKFHPLPAPIPDLSCAQWNTTPPVPSCAMAR